MFTGRKKPVDVAHTSLSHDEHLLAVEVERFGEDVALVSDLPAKIRACGEAVTARQAELDEARAVLTQAENARAGIVSEVALSGETERLLANDSIIASLKTRVTHAQELLAASHEVLRKHQACQSHRDERAAEQRRRAQLAQAQQEHAAALKADHDAVMSAYAIRENLNKISQRIIELGGGDEALMRARQQARELAALDPSRPKYAGF